MASWFLRDRYRLVYESGLTDESESLYHGETLFSLPADPTDGEIAETALALLQQAYRLARLPADSTGQAFTGGKTTIMPGCFIPAPASKQKRNTGRRWRGSIRRNTSRVI